MPSLLNFLAQNISPNGEPCNVSLKSFENDRPLIATQSQITYYFEFDIVNDMRNACTSCIIPINGNLLLVLSFEDKFEMLKEFEEYFECIQAILKLYLLLQTKKFSQDFISGTKLSARQLLIHKMMVTGKTNRQIASELSYSISLIKQETMRIYVKLGIDGRNEIKRDRKIVTGNLTDEITGNTN